MYVGTPITSAHIPKNIGGPKSMHRESFLPRAFLYAALRRQHKDEKPTHERKAALKPYEAQSIENPL